MILLVAIFDFIISHLIAILAFTFITIYKGLQQLNHYCQFLII